MPASESSRPDADRIENLLADVVTLPDGEQAAVLSRLCDTHPELAADLQLRYGMFLRMAAPVLPSRGDDQLPRRFGEYTLLRELGSGGMGVVYLASQQRGEGQRLVALKLVRDRLALSPQAQERLRREGAAAFRLDHPGICQAYDLGEVEGTPFVSMRYVPGRTLAELLAEARADDRSIELPDDGSNTRSNPSSTLTSGGRRKGILLLIEQVARALHAAHEAGFVHRDVKPGNVIVGNDGVPVLLDFGLVHDADSSHGLTLTDQPIGTPNYMSPEQIAPRGRRVDRTTDIYSLGVTLYELLAGELPFAAKNREELFRQVLETPPPRLPKRAPGISRDVEIIVHTAIAKDPDRRYHTALAFAEDLRNARLAQPIIARPPSLARRLALWSRRNPLAAIMIALLALSQGLIVLLALRADDRALEAEAAKQLAEANYREAALAIEELGNVATEQLADVPWLVSVRRVLFEKVLAFHERAAQRPLLDDSDRLRAVRAWVQSAHLQQGLGRNAEAEALLQRALTTLARTPQTPDSMRWAISANVLRANLAQERGDFPTAESALEAAISDCRQLEARPDSSATDRQIFGSCNFELAELLAENVGRRADAIRAIDVAIAALGDSSADNARLGVAAALRLRAQFARLDGDEARSLDDLERAVTMLRQLVAAKPHDRTPKASLATALISQGLAQKELDKNREALASYGEARQVYEELVAAFPFHLNYRVNLGKLHNNLAVLQRRIGDAESSRAALLRALDIGRESLRLEPGSSFAQSVVADSSYNLANQMRREDPREAEVLYRESLVQLDDLLRHNPDSRASLDMACRANTSLGALYANQKRFPEALAAFLRAREVTESLFAAQSPSPRLLRGAAILDYNTGTLIGETGGELGEAIDCLRGAVRHGELLLDNGSDDPRTLGLVLSHRVRLATLVEMQDPSVAAAAWNAAQAMESAMNNELRGQLEGDEGSRFAMACSARGLATAELRNGRFAAAATLLARAASLLAPSTQIATEVESLLLAHGQLALAAATRDVPGAASASRRMAESARRLLTRVDESPLQRRRLAGVLPALRDTLETHGEPDHAATLEALSRALDG